MLGGRGHTSQTPGNNNSVTSAAFTPPTTLSLKRLLGSSGLKALPPESCFLSSLSVGLRTLFVLFFYENRQVIFTSIQESPYIYLCPYSHSHEPIPGFCSCWTGVYNPAGRGPQLCGTIRITSGSFKKCQFQSHRFWFSWSLAGPRKLFFKVLWVVPMYTQGWNPIQWAMANNKQVN